MDEEMERRKRGGKEIEKIERESEKVIGGIEVNKGEMMN